MRSDNEPSRAEAIAMIELALTAAVLCDLTALGQSWKLVAKPVGQTLDPRRRIDLLWKGFEKFGRILYLGTLQC